MSVQFQIISAYRYPGAYIEIDGSKAGLGSGLPAVLLVGQKLAGGSAPAGVLAQISSVQDAINKFGAGSMLAQMAARYRAIDPTFDLWAMPYSDNGAGVQAAGTITVSAVPTAAGTLSLYIAGRLVSVGVTANQALASVATAIAAAVTATADLPCSAAAVGAVVTLTALHKGTCGNSIDVRLGLYGEPTPTGLGLSLAAFTGGSGDPAPGSLSAVIGQHWFRYVALGMNDAATLAAWHAESQTRYKPPIQAGFRAFTALRGDYATAATYGAAANYEHICCLGLELNPTSTWEAAAIVAAAAGPALWNNPVNSLEGVPLTGLVGKTYFDWTSANSLLFKGVSVMQAAPDGSCSIKRLVTMYQYRPDGSADDAYLDVNTPEVLERIRFEQRYRAYQQFAGTAAAKSNEGYRPGLQITTVDSVKAFLLSTYKNVLLAQNGWVQEYAYYKSTLVVEQDPQNPSRFNYLDAPVILSPFYILAGREQFRKAV